jgi:hypothetical protein
MSVFEIIMLICFGLSWPISIYKSVRTKTVAGKSPLFMTIVILGYASGIIHKVLYSYDWVIALYAANLMLVGVDMGVYFYYSRSARASAI